jgi:uncharacterized protein (PEP-CTERM system associated)
MQLRSRIRFVAIASFFCALEVGFQYKAQAQTVDYFSTPWIVSPLPPNGGNASQIILSNGGGGTGSPGAYSTLYSHAAAQSAPNAPPWSLTENLGIDELATDNVGETSGDRVADLGSLFSAGLVGTADSTRLSGIISATGVYRRDINDGTQNGFSGYGYANGRATIIPDALFFSINGMMDDLSREGGGLQNALAQTATTTKSYSISGSPYLYTRAGDFGVNVFRYQLGQVWFDNNTGAIETPGVNIGPISSSTDQDAREDFKMTGTLLPRLSSDVSLSRTENDSGTAGSGDYTNLSGELINEYEVTRYASAISGAGYEQLRDNDFPKIDGEGPTWDIGTRLRPDPDSYVLLTYGRHDLKSDFAGELWWQVSDRSNVYAAYTDSISNSQQSVTGYDSISQVGPDGATAGVSFNQSTLIGTLDDRTLNAGPGGQGSGSPLGVPLADINNALPLQNGLFRNKSFQSSARTQIDDNPLSLTVYYLQSTQLTPTGFSNSQVGQVETSTGGIFSWFRELGPDLSGLASAGYNHSNQGNADVYNGTIGLTRTLSQSLSVILRYDVIYRDAHPSTGAYLQNVITIGLHKSFD